MLDLSKINREHFGLTFEDGSHLDINPPKIKVLNKLMELSNPEVKEVERFIKLQEGVQMILQSNKQKKKISKGFIEENFDAELLAITMREYLKWVTAIKIDPN